MMNTESNLWRNPVVSFVILVYVLSFPLILLLRFVDLPFMPILIYASWTPNIAAFLVLGLILREKGGIRRLISGWGKWRVRFQWYLVAISPLLMAFLIAGVNLVLGGVATGETLQLGTSLLGFLIVSIITGATGEELGWRGFLLPRLQERFTGLSASLIVGVIWAFWHLPLWFLPGYGWDIVPYWAFALATVSSSVIYTFVVNKTDGSMLMASIFHMMTNYGLNLVGTLGLLPSPGETWIIASVLYTLYAIIIVILAGTDLSRLKTDTPPSFS
jgi:membrane protease YdiL (CAAX protease family)